LDAHRLNVDVGEQPVFPVTSVVHRGRTPMKVLGRKRPVTIYICGASWLARTRTRGRYLWISGFATDPRTLEVVELDPDEIAAAQDRTEAATRWMYDHKGPDPLRPHT
jgi:hypothetical protein